MGCFSMSCNLSNLSIYNDEIAVMLIKKNKYCDSHISKNSICSNEGASAFYEPYSPLIYGNCDTYGNIENIEETEAFKWTCRKLDIKESEEAFHNYINEDWMCQSEDGIAIAFFNKIIVNKAIEYQRNQDSLFNYHHQHWILEKFPEFFTLKETLSDSERYKFIYSIKNSDKLIKSDGKYINNGVDEYGLYNTKDVLNYINNKNITQTVLNTKVDTYIEFLYDEEIKEKEEWENLFKDIAIKSPLRDYFKYGITKNFKDSKTIRKEVCDTFLLSNFMFLCNRYYYPSFTGTQHNDFKNLDYLNKISQHEIDLYKKEYSDEEE